MPDKEVKRMKVEISIETPIQKGSVFVKEIDGKKYFFQLVDIQDSLAKNTLLNTESSRTREEIIKAIENKRNDIVEVPILKYDDPFGVAIKESDFSVDKEKW